VFKEDKRWNWDKRHEEVSVADLEWGENEKGAILDTETGEEGATDFNNNTREEDGANFNNNTAEFNNNKGGENPNNNPNNPPNTDVEGHQYGWKIMKQDRDFLKTMWLI
jgi:hypothetical protein